MLTSVAGKRALRCALQRSVPAHSVLFSGPQPLASACLIAAAVDRVGASVAPFSSADRSTQNVGRSLALQSLKSDLRALEDLHGLFLSDDTLPDRFDDLLLRLTRCYHEQRCVFVTGIGKSGIVARRLASALASIAVRSQWIHGSEWVHGDLGNLQPGDMVIIFSHSGNTAELLSLPSMISKRYGDAIAIVGQNGSKLEESSSLTLVIPAEDRPSCPVPTRSIIVQEAISNAIVESLVYSIEKRADTFKANHPGGAIGHYFSKE